MIAIDTNVLIRYLVQDHPTQSRAAARLLEEAEARGTRCFLSHIVLCEMVWVLESCYRRSHRHIVSVLQHILHTGFFCVEQPERLEQVVHSYQTGHADFADYLILAESQVEGAKPFYTFDRQLHPQRGVTLLS